MSAKGNKVLLPAPGGACTMSVLFSANFWRTSTIISVTGRSDEKGLKVKIEFELEEWQIY